MNNLTYYQGSDGHVKVLGDNELQHWKYIKKIGNQYFYSMEALQAYYHHQQRMANAEYKIDQHRATRERSERDKFRRDVHNDLRKNAENTTVMYRNNRGDLKFRDQTKAEKKVARKQEDDRYRREQRMNKIADTASDAAMQAKRVAKPVAKTAKRAVTPIDPKKAAQKKIDKILNQPPRRKKPTTTRRHNTVKPSRYRQYTAASRW